MDFESTGRKHIPEPDLVPILDALTSVIFFLLLSATFMTLTKLTVPPAQVSTAKASDVIPMNPVFIVKEHNGELLLKLSWKGSAPGEIVRQLSRMMPRNLDLLEKTQEIVKDFSARFSNEKTMQLSLSNQIQYQELITVMDGLRTVYQDIVLVSPDLANMTTGGAKK